MQTLNEQTWFETALCSIGDAVIATDESSIVMFMNPAAERITGWTKEEAYGKPFNEAFHIINEDTRQQIVSVVPKMIRHDSVFELAKHTLLVSRDGTEYAIDSSAAPIGDDLDKAESGIVIVFHDITA
jgi:PAS domain S-box-containing protein